MTSDARAVLLLFSQEDAKLLRQDSYLCGEVVSGKVQVVSLDPDLSLDSLPSEISVYQPEITSNLPLSKTTSELVRRVLSALHRQAMLDSMDETCVKLFLTMDNDLHTYYYKPLAVLFQRLQMTIARFRPSQLLMFHGSHAEFCCPERPEIAFCLGPSAHYRSAAQLLAAAYPIPLEHIAPDKQVFVSLRRRTRNLAFQSARYSILTYRFLKSRLARGQWKAQSPLFRGRPSIGVLIRGESELYSAQPVLGKLEASGVQTIVLQDEIFKDPSAEAALRREKVEFFPLYSLISVAEFLRALRQASRFKQMLNRSIRRIPDLSTREDNFENRVLVGREVSQQILRAAAERMPETMVFFTALDNLMKVVRPGVILSMSMVDHWGATIRVICDQHGGRVYALQNAAMRVEYYPTAVAAHKLLLGSEDLMEDFVRMGVSRTQVDATGLPQYDQYIKMRGKGWKPSVVFGEAVGQRDKVVVITNSPYRQPKEKEMIRAVLQALFGHRDVLTIIKLHPRQDPRLYQDIAAYIKNRNMRAVVAARANTLQLLSVADLVVSRLSSTILSAYMIGTPVVSFLDPEDRRKLLSYLTYPGIQSVSTLEELCAAVPQALFSREWSSNFQKQRKQFLQGLPTTADGKATDRVVRHLLEALVANGGK